jgi:hypothetical protein
MPVPSDMVQDYAAACRFKAIMEQRVAAWIDQNCLFIPEFYYMIGGRRVLVTGVRGLFFAGGDGVAPEIIWDVDCVAADGEKFTVSERSMPTSGNPQN